MAEFTSAQRFSDFKVINCPILWGEFLRSLGLGLLLRVGKHVYLSILFFLLKLLLLFWHIFYIFTWMGLLTWIHLENTIVLRQMLLLLLLLLLLIHLVIEIIIDCMRIHILLSIIVLLLREQIIIQISTLKWLLIWWIFSAHRMLLQWHFKYFVFLNTIIHLLLLILWNTIIELGLIHLLLIVMLLLLWYIMRWLLWCNILLLWSSIVKTFLNLLCLLLEWIAHIVVYKFILVIMLHDSLISCTINCSTYCTLHSKVIIYWILLLMMMLEIRWLILDWDIVRLLLLLLIMRNQLWFSLRFLLY